jgi:hypothetical protein
VNHISTIINNIQVDVASFYIFSAAEVQFVHI